MEFDNVFADLGLTVTIKAKNNVYFGKLNDMELIILGQWIWLACNCFMTTEQLRILDALNRKKQSDIEKQGGDEHDDLSNN